MGLFLLHNNHVLQVLGVKLRPQSSLFTQVHFAISFLPEHGFINIALLAQFDSSAFKQPLR